MHGSFERFTERARRVLTRAEEEARRLNHNYIGTEHLLLALVRESEGGAITVLNNLHIVPETVRANVEALLGRGERHLTGDIALTPRSKKVIALAADEARQLGHHYIGTEHFLLGLIREGEGVAAGVLENLGLTLEQARAEVVKALSSSDVSSRAEHDIKQVIRDENFTERARRALTLAEDEARRFNHRYIGTEHILLGLTAQREGLASSALTSFGVDLPTVRRAVEFIIGRGESQVFGDIGLTPRSKKVLTLANDEKRRLGHEAVGTEHLLLGLIREGEGIAAGVLESLGVDLERARARVIKGLAGSAGPDGNGAGPLATAAWEYLIVPTGVRDSEVVVHESFQAPDRPALAGQPIEFALATLGKVGWELAGIDSSIAGDGPHALYIFKRRRR